MTQSLYEGFGGLALPVDDSAVSTTLTPLDPARAVLSGLFAAAINAELSAAWAIAAAGTPLAAQQPVADVLELPPTGPRMKQRKAVFPLLCVYRDGSGVTEQATLNGQIEKLTQPWTVDYIIGPAGVGDERKLGDVFQAVVKIIRLCIRRRGHPAYQGGAVQFFPAPVNEGATPVVPLFPRASLIGAIELKSYDGPPSYQARFAGDESNTVYHAVSLHIETLEHTYDADGIDAPAEAMGIQANAGGSDGVVPGLVYGSTDAPFQFG